MWENEVASWTDANHDPLEPSVEAQTTEDDPFSFSGRPKDDSTVTDFNQVFSDQNQVNVCFACFIKTIYSI